MKGSAAAAKSRARSPEERRKAIDELAAELESITASLTELEEEQGGDEGAFSELEKVNKASVAAQLKKVLPTLLSFRAL